MNSNWWRERKRKNTAKPKQANTTVGQRYWIYNPHTGQNPNITSEVNVDFVAKLDSFETSHRINFPTNKGISVGNRSLGAVFAISGVFLSITICSTIAVLIFCFKKNAVYAYKPANQDSDLSDYSEEDRFSYRSVSNASSYSLEQTVRETSLCEANPLSLSRENKERQSLLRNSNNYTTNDYQQNFYMVNQNNGRGKLRKKRYYYGFGRHARGLRWMKEKDSVQNDCLAVFNQNKPTATSNEPNQGTIANKQVRRSKSFPVNLSSKLSGHKPKDLVIFVNERTLLNRYPNLQDFWLKGQNKAEPTKDDKPQRNADSKDTGDSSVSILTNPCYNPNLRSADSDNMAVNVPGAISHTGNTIVIDGTKSEDIGPMFSRHRLDSKESQKTMLSTIDSLGSMCSEDDTGSLCSRETVLTDAS